MHPAVASLVESLSRGVAAEPDIQKGGVSPIEGLARVYEIARNSLEYRAEHLVRRAAIERILRRQLVFGYTSQVLSERLLEELKWARYVSYAELARVTPEVLRQVVEKYLGELTGPAGDKDWLIGMVSADIEEAINPNLDYHKFTNFAFHGLRQRVDYPDQADLDLILYIATDRVYSQSDEAQVAFHLYKLLQRQVPSDEKGEVLRLCRQYYKSAMTHPLLGRLSTYVRQQAAPLILLRDLYFAQPEKFASLLTAEEEFATQAKQTLSDQLRLADKRLKTATVRSLIYVFLTKMLLVLAVEIPLERLMGFRGSFITLGVNLVFPVAVMWVLAARVGLPDAHQQDQLVRRAWQIVANFGDPPPADEILRPAKSEHSALKNGLFYALYGLLFVLIFSLIIKALRAIGFGLVSQAVFVFFLCIISFFAYRIRQAAQTYFWRPRVSLSPTVAEMLLLPIVVAGGWLSRGVARLNFLAFIFDFILEAPFKILLRFLDGWSQFLSLKRDEAVG